MVMGGGDFVVQAGHHDRARRGTERCDAACIGVHDALRSQTVDVRGLHIRAAVAAKVQGHVLGQDEKDVGPAGAFGRGGLPGPGRQARRRCQQQEQGPVRVRETLCHDEESVKYPFLSL